MQHTVTLVRRERFFRLNQDGTLGGNGEYQDVPAGTSVEVQEVKHGQYLVKRDGLHARVWASWVRLNN